MSQPVTPEERFSAALHATARSWRLAIDARLKDLGIGQAGWMTIAMIAKSKQPPSQRELADLLGIEDHRWSRCSTAWNAAAWCGVRPPRSTGASSWPT